MPTGGGEQLEPIPPETLKNTSTSEIMNQLKKLDASERELCKKACEKISWSPEHKKEFQAQIDIIEKASDLPAEKKEFILSLLGGVVGNESSHTDKIETDNPPQNSDFLERETFLKTHLESFKSSFPDTIPLQGVDSLLQGSQDINNSLMSLRVSIKNLNRLLLDKKNATDTQQLAQVNSDINTAIQGFKNSDLMNKLINNGIALTEEQLESLSDPEQVLVLLDLLLIVITEEKHQHDMIEGKLDFTSGNLTTTSSLRGMVSAFNRNEDGYNEITKFLQSSTNTEKENAEQMVKQYIHYIQPEGYNSTSNKNSIGNITFDTNKNQISYTLNDKAMTLPFGNDGKVVQFSEFLKKHSSSEGLKKLYNLDAHNNMLLDRSHVNAQIDNLIKKINPTNIKVYNNVFEMWGDALTKMFGKFSNLAAMMYDALGGFVGPKYRGVMAYYSAMSETKINSSFEKFCKIDFSKEKERLQKYNVDENVWKRISGMSKKDVLAAFHNKKNTFIQLPGGKGSVPPGSEQYFFAVILNDEERLLYILDNTARTVILQSKLVPQTGSDFYGFDTLGFRLAPGVTTEQENKTSSGEEEQSGEEESKGEEGKK